MARGLPSKAAARRLWWSFVAASAVACGAGTTAGTSTTGLDSPDGGACTSGATQICYMGPPASQNIGECRDGSQTCVSNVWSACVGSVSPVTEICDGKDNNCNGIVDEGCSCTSDQSRDCYTGSPATEGIGNCTAGKQDCQGKVWSDVCTGEQTPLVEICDGIDNNCNGLVDEPPLNCSCDMGQSRSCYDGPPATAGVGVCVSGTQICDTGHWGACTGEVVPSPEICDGKDNDCNGLVDDGDPSGGNCSTGLQGVCAPGTATCTSGMKHCSQRVQPSPEVCDGLDNNCNGQVDEGNPGGGMGCSTGKPGVCGAGATACVAGAITCNQTTQPSPETCDGLDNNCNGQVDEGNPGGGVACATGALGECAAGTSACTAGKIVCNENVAASPEICDGADNNCNGQVDEGNPGGGAACSTGELGVCAAGTVKCVLGVLACVENVAASAEVCDGLDNDCDGTVDNGATCPAGDTCTSGACVPIATCPFVYSYDGQGFAYETTVGGASLTNSRTEEPITDRRFEPLWAALGHGVVDYGAGGHARAKLLIAEDEIAYVDEVHLTAVSAPIGYEVFTSSSTQWFALGRRDPEELYAFRSDALRAPVHASWQGRVDVSTEIARLDDRAIAEDVNVDNFYELDFGKVHDPLHATLVVDGWKFDEPRALPAGTVEEPPRLEVRAADGTWQRALRLAQPRGDRKTVVVDLSSVEWPGGRYRMRFYTGTNEDGLAMWHIDRVRLTEERSAPVEVTDIPASSAGLHFFGTPSYIDGENVDHPRWNRDDGLGVLPEVGPWGRFTRYGDVRSLLGAADDQLVILRQGDGIDLAFDGVPPARDGQKLTLFLRTELLFKPRLCLTCSEPNELSGGVYPLPFHGMTRYPYGAAESYPDDEAHRHALDAFDTREYIRGERRWGP